MLYYFFLSERVLNNFKLRRGSLIGKCKPPSCSKVSPHSPNFRFFWYIFADNRLAAIGLWVYRSVHSCTRGGCLQVHLSQADIILFLLHGNYRIMIYIYIYIIEKSAKNKFANLCSVLN